MIRSIGMACALIALSGCSSSSSGTAGAGGTTGTVRTTTTTLANGTTATTPLVGGEQPTAGQETPGVAAEQLAALPAQIPTVGGDALPPGTTGTTTVGTTTGLCATAVKTVTACGFVAPSTPANCDGSSYYTCNAKCMIGRSCAEIAALYAGKDNALSRCIGDCGDAPAQTGKGGTGNTGKPVTAGAGGTAALICSTCMQQATLGGVDPVTTCAAYCK